MLKTGFEAIAHLVRSGGISGLRPVMTASPGARVLMLCAVLAAALLGAAVARFRGSGHLHDDDFVVVIESGLFGWADYLDGDGERLGWHADGDGVFL